MIASWLAHAGRIALQWVVTRARFVLWVTRPDKGDAPAERRGCALVCGPFLRGAPILSADERAKLWRFVEAQIPERNCELGGRVPGDGARPRRPSGSNPATESWRRDGTSA